MTKQELLEIIKLLSALESWSFSLDKSLPDHLLEDIANAQERLAKELLK